MLRVAGKQSNSLDDAGDICERDLYGAALRLGRVEVKFCG
jgi:hypothetical protein